jgi:transcriptional regulator with XRE-family HTH domain
MNDTITKRIKHLRYKKGFSQEDMANKLCISQSAYAKLESGKTYTWATHLEKLCEIFEVNPQDIVRQEQVVINQHQQGGNSNNAYIINQLSEKLIEQYEKHLADKDEIIALLKHKNR